MSFGPLVNAEWLRDHRQDSDVRVIDFRWYLLDRKGRDEYLRGHIPGAVFVDLEAVTGPQDFNARGRHPLPTAEQFEVEMQRAGVSATTRVIVYDDAGSSVAARLWFLLGWFGHETQAVLDGGVQAWGRPLETDLTSVGRGTFRSQEPDRSRILDFDEIRALGGVPLLDARAGERYRGEKEPIDPKAGHIPGAISAPWMENLGPDGRFKSPAELRARFAELGAADGAVVYCGSGVNATHDLLAMEVAGLHKGRLYAGSWSDWSNRDAPVATGKEPG
ncbi:MAG TPA: sulfurtransferase [Candidatus Dormibacteraeota bacterium]|nr:sulfurtransferase [Candidatus Dormibacteraeota bacterium]